MVLAALAMSVVGCARQRRIPEWVEDPSVLRDPDVFIVGVGSGLGMTAAEQDAEDELLRKIKAETGGEDVDLVEYRRRVTQAGGEPEVTMELLSLDSFEAAAPMVGMEFVERWADSRNSRQYVMVAVNKARLVNAYETEMRINAALANRMAERAKQEQVTLRRFTQLRTALAAASAYSALRQARGKLAGPLSGYDPSLDPPDASSRELRDQIAAMRSEVAASIERVGDEVPIVIETEIKSALQRLSVPVRTDEEQGDVRILVTFAVLPVNEHVETARLVNWRLNVEVVEDSSGRSMSTLALDGKTGSVSMEDARAEAARLARIDLHDKIDDFLNETLFEQSLNQ
jgi:hypothetical protein